MTLVILPILFVLTIAALLTSVLSGATGMGGGVILLAVMALLVDMAYVVPLHGVVQFYSNGFRTFLFFKHTDWRLFCCYAVGLLPGAFLGIYVFQHLDKDVVALLMGIFILLITWMPKFRNEHKESILIFIPVGVVSGVISIFFGATGPFLAPFFVRKDILKEQLIATKAACQTLAHILKIPLFASIGFNIFQFWPTLLFLCGAVMIGTYFGKKLVGKMTDKQFKGIIKWMLTAVSIKMIITAIYLITKVTDGVQ
jgi:uncharacterized membrane protein YfcA